ncbi:MAG: hypothetical protein PHE06_13770 [Lachnospiraceae bacterium]|nr:hypothetical protein [Lachnospiraceae bacterium]
MDQMDNVVTRLSEIDTAAQAIVDQAAGKKKELETQMNQDLEKFDQDLAVKTKEMLADLKKKLTENMQQQLVSLKEGMAASQAQLEEEYRERHEQLAEELFRKIIEVS